MPYDARIFSFTFAVGGVSDQFKALPNDNERVAIIFSGSQGGPFHCHYKTMTDILFTTLSFNLDEVIKLKYAEFGDLVRFEWFVCSVGAGAVINVTEIVKVL